jgi:hypothetical protein
VTLKATGNRTIEQLKTAVRASRCLHNLQLMFDCPKTPISGRTPHADD